jgi:hypothetical protein
MPIGYLQSVNSVIDRIQNPQIWTPYIDHLALEELSESSIRLRTADGAKAVYQRGVPADD